MYICIPICMCMCVCVCVCVCVSIFVYISTCIYRKRHPEAQLIRSSLRLRSHSSVEEEDTCMASSGLLANVSVLGWNGLQYTYTVVGLF